MPLGAYFAVFQNSTSEMFFLRKKGRGRRRELCLTVGKMVVAGSVYIEEIQGGEAV